MRRGERTTPWTSEEERWLREMGPVLGRRACCSHLRRTSSAVKAKAHRMGVSLRAWKPRCSLTCPECGAARTALGRSGTCRPCELRALVAKADAETAEAMERLPASARAVYQSSEAKLGAPVEPRPAAPRTDGMGAYRQARARDEHAAEVEAWEVRVLTRQMKARRRRLERMLKKIPKSMQLSEDA